ncbi:MAG: hypothetical protein QM655_16315 [Nocardioidaceae bacterium]
MSGVAKPGTQRTAASDLSAQQWAEINMMLAAVDTHLSTGPGRPPMLSAAVALIDLAPAADDLAVIRSMIRSEFEQQAALVALPRQADADALLPLDRTAAVGYLERQRDRRLATVAFASECMALDA